MTRDSHASPDARDRTDLPDDLRRALRGLHRDSEPGQDLWPGIAARLAPGASRPDLASPQAMPQMPGAARARAQRRRPRRLAPLATAASLAAALALGWNVLPPRTAGTGHEAAVAGLILGEARAMTRDYEAAWRALDARRRPGADADALRELDRSAAEVRAALRRDPGARYLFDRLQSVYAQRLALAQRLATPT